MPRYIKKIWSGDVLEVEEYFSPRKIGMRYQRGTNESLTTEEQKELNLRWARKNLSRKINANFKQGDLFLTLTHREEVGYEESKRLLRNFLKRLKRLRKKKELEDLKYVAVTENEGIGKSGEKVKEHHHLVMNEIELSPKEMTELWGHGRVLVSVLEPGGDYTGISQYITKECNPDNSKRWSCSRNLKQPKQQIKQAKEEKATRRMNVPKGYKEVERFEYVSEKTGVVRYMKAIRIGGEDYAEGKMEVSHIGKGKHFENG